MKLTPDVIKKILDGLSPEENKTILLLFNIANTYQKFFLQKKLDAEKKFLTDLLQNFPTDTTDFMLSLKRQIVERLENTEQRISTVNTSKHMEILTNTKGGGNNSIMNWVIYELDKICKIWNGTDWQKIISILKYHPASPMLLEEFDIEEKIVREQDGIDLVKKRIYSFSWGNFLNVRPC